jgi:hypothetical protein
MKANFNVGQNYHECFRLGFVDCSFQMLCPFSGYIYVYCISAIEEHNFTFRDVEISME